MAHEQKHPYHLVEPSPWPLVGAGGAFVMAMGGIFYMRDIPYGGLVALIGLLLVLKTMYFWWRDVVREAHYQGHQTPVVQLGARYGMLLFITSEVMFFLAFFWAFFDMALYPRLGTWPPAGIVPFDAFDLPFINTLILLLSGTTVTWAHAALIDGKRRELLIGLGLTIVLGAMFTALQAFEYSHAAFSFNEGIYPSTFYMATGFHGFHVIVGTIFLTVCWFRAYAGHFTPEQHFGFEAAAWYWHFVDVVWLFLFVCIYWWGA